MLNMSATSNTVQSNCLQHCLCPPPAASCLVVPLQERVQADRRDNQRLPSLLTVTLDVLTTSTQHSSDVAGAGGGGSGAAAAAAGSSGGGGGGGRSTPQTWRAGSAAVSRSVPLGRPVAKQMADEALKLVKRWSRERCV